MTTPEPLPTHVPGACNAGAGTRFDVDDCPEAAARPPPVPNIACDIQTRLDHAIP